MSFGILFPWGKNKSKILPKLVQYVTIQHQEVYSTNTLVKNFHLVNVFGKMPHEKSDISFFNSFRESPTDQLHPSILDPRE